MAGAGKSAGDNGVTEFQFYQPDNRTKWQSFQRAIYDKSTNQILGRTPKSWGQLLLFYSIFYICLAAMFAICMQGLFASLDDRAPTWQLDSSLIGINPGLGYRPMPNDTKDGSLIWYNITNQTTTDIWVNLTNEFLVPYQKNQTQKNFVDCNFQQPPEGKVCATSIDHFGNCTPENSYGYNSRSPCIFLKLNRIYGWQPKFITEPTADMPKDLKNTISELKANNKSQELEQIWVTCNGIDAIDKENIEGFSYNPSGFAGHYYPYTNEKNYLSPIVAVQIQNVTPNVIVNVECRAWAANIKYVGGTLNRAGSVTFEIQVDTAKPAQPQVLSAIVAKKLNTNTSSTPMAEDPQTTENVPVTSSQSTIENNPVTQAPVTSVTN